jgi:hypothetical protein
MLEVLPESIIPHCENHPSKVLPSFLCFGSFLRSDVPLLGGVSSLIEL